MGINVINIFRPKAGILQGHTQTARRPFTVFRWSSDMIGITAGAVAGYLRIDRGSAFQGMFQLFNNEHPGTLGHDEPIPIFIKRPGGLLWCIITGGKGLHGAEASNPKWTDYGLSTTSNHHITAAIHNGAIGLTNGMGPCGAGS